MANEFLAGKLHEAKETARRAADERREREEEYQKEIAEEEQFKARVVAANDKAMAIAGFAGLDMDAFRTSNEGDYRYAYTAYEYIPSKLIPLGLIDVDEENGRTHGFAKVVMRDRTFERTFHRSWTGIMIKDDDPSRIQAGFEVKLLAGTEHGDNLFLMARTNTHDFTEPSRWYDEALPRREQLTKAEQFIDIAYAAVTNTEVRV